MDTLGIVESISIAAGIELSDEMMKAADVEFVRASTICSGRYMIYVAGDRDAVQTSVGRAVEAGRRIKGSFIISNISSQVVHALKKSSAAGAGDAIGIIECRSASSGVAAADAAVKRSDVVLCKLVTGQGINGKSYFVISGDVACVEEAADSAVDFLGSNLIEAVVIPNPNSSILKNLTGVLR